MSSMYDRITIRLDRDRLPCGYEWRAVLSMTESRMLYAKGNGGRGVWRGGWVTAREWGKSNMQESGPASELRRAVESYLTWLYERSPDGMAF